MACCPSFRMCMASLIHLHGKTLWLSVDHRRLEPVEVESKTGRTFTRSLRASSLTEHNKSALTDHARISREPCHQLVSSNGVREVHVRESERPTYGAIHQSVHPSNSKNNGLLAPPLENGLDRAED